MTPATATKTDLKVEYINPIISATKSVFETMLNCTIERTDLILKKNSALSYEVSGVIGISGKISGTIVLSLSHHTALEILYRLVGTKTSFIDDEVCDAVGELTNMIAGQAKGQLERYELSASIPTIVTGRNHLIQYGSNVKPMCILFDSGVGPFAIEVGFASPNHT